MVQKFDKYMFPILDWLKDGGIRTNKEAQERMVEYFQHTEKDIKRARAYWEKAKVLHL